MKKAITVVLGMSLLALMIACGGKEGSSSSASSDSASVSEAKKEAPAAATTSATNRKGKLVYKQYCVACHGADGKLGVSGAKDLSASTISLEERINQVTNGKGLMTPYKDILSEEQIKSVCEYIVELRS